MRGEDERSGSLFSYVDLEARVGENHPLRAIRMIVNEALAALAGDFSALYSRLGRPSIPPEKLLRAILLQTFYSIRSERLLMERLEYDLLFRWFVRDRRRRRGVGPFGVLEEPRSAAGRRHRGEVPVGGAGTAHGEKEASVHRPLLGGRHADRGMGVHEERQTEGWLGANGRPRGGGRNTERDFHGQKRSNDTHASTTDPEARLYRKGKGKEAKLCFMGHGLMGEPPRPGWSMPA